METRVQQKCSVRLLSGHVYDDSCLDRSPAHKTPHCRDSAVRSSTRLWDEGWVTGSRQRQTLPLWKSTISSEFSLDAFTAFI